MSQIRKMRREQERGRREEWRDHRRQLARREANHVCVPVLRGEGHAYAYCKHCGRAMAHVKQPAVAVTISADKSTTAADPLVYKSKLEEVEHAV